MLQNVWEPLTYGVLKLYFVPNRKKLAQNLQEAEETIEATNSKCASLEKRSEEHTSELQSR